MHYTLPQLIALDERYPTQRKLLLVPSINFGRELLAALAHARGAWIGWEPATLATIAQKLALVELARRGLRRASDVAIADTISSAFDDAVALSGKQSGANSFSPELAALTWSSGTRGAVVDAVLELRTARVTSEQVRSVGDVGVAPSLAAILARYEQLLDDRHMADSNAVFRAAIDAFDAEAPMVLDHAVMVATPGWTVRGASRVLFAQMVGRGLRVLVAPLPPDQIAPPGLVDSFGASVELPLETGIVSPAPAMFCAGSPADEMREIVRRALAAGHSLDEIEIASTDRDTYGVALEALCTHIGATTTIVDGLPLAVTRIGRAVERWFSWLESDFTASHLRNALESGDWKIDAKFGASVGTQLAGELRRLRIGWGVEATKRAAERLRSPDWRTIKLPFEDETPEAREVRQSARNRNADALLSLIDLLLAQVPSPRIGDESAAISVAELSVRTLAVLTLVHPHGPAERATLQRLSQRLVEVSEVSNPRVSLMQALATLRQELADLRAWTNASETSRPRRATGGHIHLTNLDSAGATGRPLLFLVGLDADRTAGPVLQSPLLPDSLRVRLNDRGADLPTIEHRRRERAWHLHAALVGANARVTLSYAIRGGADGRDASPAPALLQVARNATGNAGMGYDELRQLFGTPVSPVPNVPADAIDARDVLLAHMSDGALLLNGNDAARALFPGLDRGLNAVTVRAGEEAGAYHGIVPDAGCMDPRRTQQPISPSSLEMIAACSLRWFYSTALNARLTEEPVFDAMVWLNVLERGSALHLIYERIVREHLYEQPSSDARRAKVLEIVNGVADEYSKVVPVANTTIRAREILALDNDAQLFVNSEHDAFLREPWEVLALESAFGYETGDDGATLPLDDGTSVRVHGRVDRVDRLRDGTLRLVDYKTGRSFELNTKRGAFDGGRKLQLAVYSPAVSRQFDAAVSAAEYHFPTKKGDGVVARADRELLDAAPRIVRSLLDDVAAGRFVATIDKSDCAFCNFAAICRTRVDDWNATTSPRAEWAKERASTSPHYAGVLNRTSRLGDDS
ncbi:MAG: PD-(D/E)XK nuclease family protein [Gemmatimonadaceae bacterium]